LGLKDVLAEIKAETADSDCPIDQRIHARCSVPTPEDIAKSFMEITDTSKQLEHEESALKEFFALVDLISNDMPEVIDKFASFSADKKGNYIAFSLPNVFKLVKERDNRGEKKLQNVSKFDLTAELRTKFHASCKTHRIGSFSMSSYKLYLDDIFEKLGVRVYRDKNEREIGLENDLITPMEEE